MLAKCNICGKIHFCIDIKSIEDWKSDWEKRWEKMDDNTKKIYQSPPSSEIYLKCFRCSNPYSNFSMVDDKQIHSNISQPILYGI